MSSLPLPSVVGQDELKRALFALAVDDDLDGALIVGEKGTAKSTAVRGLVDLLPDQRVVADCPYGCSPDDPSLQCAACRDSDDHPVETRSVPLVTLPLGATRDRVVGTLSVADALAGEADFEPGLLARAHRGYLYVDEVNLLDDHLVDVLLDAAASGVNTVERDGVSVSHPAEFTLVGTMNPEEGDLRPQLRDRFALQTTVEGCRDVADRVEIIDRALGTDEAHTATASADEQAELRDRLRSAADRRERVSLRDEFKAEIAHLCLDAGVDGHRGDIAVARTAKTLAALDGRSAVIESDVREAATYALPHRLRSTPFADEPDLEDLLEDRFAEQPPGDGENAAEDGGAGDAADAAEKGDAADDESDPESDTEPGTDVPDPDTVSGADPGGGTDRSDAGPRSGERSDGQTGASVGAADTSDAAATDGDDNADPEETGDSRDIEGSDGDETAHPIVPGQRSHSCVEVGEAVVPDLDSPVDDEGSTTAGGSRPGSATSRTARGPRVRTEAASADGPIDPASSVRAAATRGESRVTERDLRRPVRSEQTRVTIVFAVDASASMRSAMRDAKGVVLDFLRESYERRDEVAFVAFAGTEAEVLLPPTDSVTLAARHLKELPTGNRTPLPAGLERTRELLVCEDPASALVVLVTDGRANVADGSPTTATKTAARNVAMPGVDLLVIDASTDGRGGLIPAIAAETDLDVLPLSSLTPDRVSAAANDAATGADRH